MKTPKVGAMPERFPTKNARHNAKEKTIAQPLSADTDNEQPPRFTNSSIIDAFGNVKQFLLQSGDVNDGVAIALEAERLSNKYGDTLSCEDLTKILKIGTNNVRQLMNSKLFPTIKVGNRKVVSTLAFVKWSFKQAS